MYRHHAAMVRRSALDRPIFAAISIHVTRYSIRIPKQNHLLMQLAAKDREALVADAEYVRLPIGRTFARAGDSIATAYFQDSGVMSVISAMTTGHHVGVAAVGAEGVLGVAALLGKERYPVSLIVLVESSGHTVAVGRLVEVFRRSEDVRRVILEHIGTRTWELITAAACNRVHSNRQRLARWLLITTDKAGQRSLATTHEALAQLVGGPRHAVTVALNELRTKGAIAHLRGRIEIVDRTVLTAHACECYRASLPSASA
jgi:CRP-like cAMP-binding protein